MEKFGKVCKEHMIKEMVDYIKTYPNFFITSFNEISVGEIEQLRKSLKKNVSTYMVAKNTMFRRALEKSEIGINTEDIISAVSGASGVLFTKGDPVSVSRLIVNFSKNHDKVKIHAGFVNGKTISSDIIKFMSTLPSRETLLSMTVAGIKSPISGFVGILRDLLGNLVGIVNAISQKRQEHD